MAGTTRPDVDSFVSRATSSTPRTPGSPAAAGASSATAAVRVYMGSSEVTQSRPGQAKVSTSDPGSARSYVYEPGQRTLRTTSTPGYADEGTARSLVYAWYGTEKYTQWADLLVELGIIQDSQRTDIRALSEVWNDAVDLSLSFQAGGKLVDPWTAARSLAESESYTGAGSGGGGGFTGSKSSTSTSIDLTDPATAKAIINDALSQRLGRAATPEELAALTGVINSAERAAPTVSTTTSSYAGGEQTTSSTTTSGGLTGAGRSQIVADEAMRKPDYGAFQAASTYYNAMLQAIQSPV